MRDHRGIESDFEQTTIDRLQRQGCAYAFGPELAREPDALVLADGLRAFLALPAAAQAM